MPVIVHLWGSKIRRPRNREVILIVSIFIAVAVAAGLVAIELVSDNGCETPSASPADRGPTRPGIRPSVPLLAKLAHNQQSQGVLSTSRYRCVGLMLLWMSREPEPLLCGLAGGAQHGPDGGPGDVVLAGAKDG